MPIIMDYPREAAIKILYEINNNDAFINILLKKKLSDPKLKEVDKSFVNTLVYGVVKNQNYCDWIIMNHSKTKLAKISPWIKEILRIAIYQMFFLDKVPEFAAVNESVNLSKKYSKGKADKFVNGVLRSIIRNKEQIRNHQFSQKELLTIKYSAPGWLVNYLQPQYSMNEIEDFFKESLNPAPTTIRVNSLKTSKKELAKTLSEEGIQNHDGSLTDYALTIKDYADITTHASYKEGLFFIQDEAAMLVVDILDPKPDEKVLDMCSAPGGKTTHIAEKRQDRPGLIARDIFEHKISLIQSNCLRLHLENVKIECKDGLKQYPEDLGKYDKILLDAPCSGLGILRRKPDIKWKLKKEDIEEIIKMQKILLENAFKYLKPGGIVVYSTCTINKRENEDVVNHLVSKFQDAKIMRIEHKDKNIQLNQNFIQTFPQKDKCDGFFISRIVKVVISDQ